MTTLIPPAIAAMIRGVFKVDSPPEANFVVVEAAKPAK